MFVVEINKFSLNEIIFSFDEEGIDFFCDIIRSLLNKKDCIYLVGESELTEQNISGENYRVTDRLALFHVTDDMIKGEFCLEFLSHDNGFCSVDLFCNQAGINELLNMVSSLPVGEPVINVEIADFTIKYDHNDVYGKCNIFLKYH